MIAPNHDRRLQLAFLYQIVHGQAKLRPLAITQPADARRQSLKMYAFARQLDPAAQDAVLREQLEHQIVSDGDVRRVARERYPAERSAALAEQRTDIGGHEARKIVGILHAALEGEGADIVAVIEGHAAHLLQAQHALNVA